MSAPSRPDPTRVPDERRTAGAPLAAPAHLLAPVPLLAAVGLVLDGPFVLGLVASYLLGSVPFGFVLVRLVKGIDLRTVGSGNIGATNAMRALGKPLGLLAFLLDVAKGWVPAAVLAPLCTAGSGSGSVAAPDSIATAVVFAAASVVGHVFPIYLRFRGGKAVATSCGALIAIDPTVFLVGGAAWLVALGAARMVSVASLAMALAFAATSWWRAPLFTDGVFLAAGTTALFVLIVWRHRSNIGRILAGTEPKVGSGRSRSATSTSGKSPSTS